MGAKEEFPLRQFQAPVANPFFVNGINPKHDRALRKENGHSCPLVWKSESVHHA